MPRTNLRYHYPFALIAAAAGLAAATPTASAQDIPPREDQPPELDFDSIEPSGGWKVSDRITITGDVADDVGIEKVEYRVEGEKGSKPRWRKATLTSGDDGSTDGLTSATFFFQLKLKTSRFTRVHIRAIDTRGNESDGIVRRYRYDKYERHQPVDPPDTGGDNGGSANVGGGGNTDTGGGNTDTGGGNTDTGGGVTFIPGVGVVES